MKSKNPDQDIHTTWSGRIYFSKNSIGVIIFILLAIIFLSRVIIAYAFIPSAHTICRASYKSG